MKFVSNQRNIKMKKVLITVANKSIGLETAPKLLKQGYSVFYVAAI